MWQSSKESLLEVFHLDWAWQVNWHIVVGVEEVLVEVTAVVAVHGTQRLTPIREFDDANRASWGLISVVAGVDLLTAGGVKAVGVVEVGVVVEVRDLSTEGV